MPQVEAGTPFERWQAAGRLSFPDDDEGAAMYADASRMLRQVHTYVFRWFITTA